MFIQREQLDELTGLIEDTIASVCDQEMISGEKAYAILECLSIAKQRELQQ